MTIEASDTPAAAQDPAAVSILTTEQFVLQSARSLATSEAVSRVSILLTATSAALVAGAFVGQLPDPSVATSFGLVVLAALMFLGVTTFERVLQVSIEDFQFALRINRIRRFYVQHSPIASAYLEEPAEEGAVSLLRSYGVRSGAWQMLVSLAGVVSVVNGLLAGTLVSLALSSAGIREASLDAVAGLATFVAAVLLQTERQRRRRVGWRSLSAEEPAEPAAAAQR